MTDDDVDIKLVQKLAEVFDGHSNLEILQALTLFLSYMVHDKEPADGIRLLLSLAMSTAEIAYDIEGELVNIQEYLQ